MGKNVNKTFFENSRDDRRKSVSVHKTCYSYCVAMNQTLVFVMSLVGIIFKKKYLVAQLN